MLEHANNQTADNIQQGDNDTRDGIATHKF
ncbi:MAG: hypothetical protein ACD_10C00287G0003 [uncultured bacterium]|nr:MAG: hypothetical protein ACD_10C00287G0003 [uncultured bacterium]